MDESAQLVRLDPSDPDHWRAAAPYLERALARGGGGKDWGLGDVKEKALAGRVALWGFLRGNRFLGAGATAERVYPRRLVVEVLLFGCEPHINILDVLPQLKTMAKAIGASVLQGTGRKGWARTLGAQERILWELEV